MGKSLKGKELGVGITQRKDGRYQARYTDILGRRQTLYSTSYEKIRKTLMEKKEQPVGSEMTLDEWYHIWITTFKSHCRETTKRTYKVQYERVKLYLGKKKLCDLTMLDIRAALNTLQTDKSRGDTKAVLVDMLNCAKSNDLVTKNVAMCVKLHPYARIKPEKKVLNKQEINALLEITKLKGYMHDLILLSLNTGMRVGEILGLCWDCVDFDNQLIHVERTLVYLPGANCRYAFHDPKTLASRRVIPMTSEAYDILQRLKERKETIAKRYPPVSGFEDLVLVSRTNKPINETNTKSALQYFSRKAGIQTISPHVLRHTFATNCIENGMTPKVLQTILGHAKLSITMDLYCHVRTQTMREEMAAYVS